MSEVLYLYGFVVPGTDAPPPGLEGIDGRPVELLAMEGVEAVVSQVPSETYGEEALEGRLDDLAWVAPRGMAHERVVTWFVDRGSILPVRFLTLYSSRSALAEEIEPRVGEMAKRLRHFADVREWDLKISYDADVLQEHLGEISEEVAALERRMAEAGPGRRYLLERKRDEAARKGCSRAAATLARNLLDELTEGARDVRELEIPATPRELPVVLNAALLVTEERAPELREHAAARGEELGEKGIHVAFTGPWAPYRFLEMEEG